MENVNDDFILGLVKGRIGELMERMDRERPELSQEARDADVVRIGRQEVAIALASRPDLVERFGVMAAEHFLRAIAGEVRSLGVSTRRT
ncbi:MAG: hypothetical protein ABSE20_04240 [Acetobacteraceae bacterium]|jgi:hypothetical protein